MSDYVIEDANGMLMGEPVWLVEAALREGVLVGCDGGEGCPFGGHTGPGFVRYADGQSEGTYDALEWRLKGGG